MAEGYIELTSGYLTTPGGVADLNRMLRTLYENLAGDTDSVRVYQGYGTPESVITAGIGSLYLRLDGGADTTLYRKESGTGATGWIEVKQPPALPLSLGNGGTGQDLSTQNQGDLYYDNGSTNAFVRLTPGTAGQVLTTGGAAANPSWSTLAATSNVIFSYGFGGDFASNDYGFVVTPSSAQPDATEALRQPLWINDTATYRTMIRSQFSKISTIDTVRFYAYVSHSDNDAGAGGVTCDIQLNVGGQTGSVSSSKGLNGTREWINGTVDVSGLSNGTFYDVEIQLRVSDAGAAEDAYLENIVGFGE